MRHEAWRFGLRFVLAFVLWSLAARPLLPFYAREVVPVAQRILQDIHPHGAEVVFKDAYPYVRWQVELPSRDTGEDTVPFQLLAYNLTLYLAMLTAIPRLSPGRRVVMVLSGLPLFFGFHVADLLLTVESRLLTRLQPQDYAFWRSFNPWFLFVKFYASFSVMALKQVFPVFVLLIQWHGMRRLEEWSLGLHRAAMLGENSQPITRGGSR